jgi:multidrug efflux pump subunit AcrA (membrane-fusion protein)
VIEKGRRNAISEEHFSISHSLLRTQQLLGETRSSSEERVKAAEVERAKELVRDRASLDQRRQLELCTLKERTDLVRDRATLDVQTAQALSGRLRQERNQARQEALRYNQERNEARAEIVAQPRAPHSAIGGYCPLGVGPDLPAICGITLKNVARTAAYIARNVQAACLRLAEPSYPTLRMAGLGGAQ